MTTIDEPRRRPARGVRRAFAVVCLALASACGGPGDGQRAGGPATTASTAAPPTTAAAAARPCLRATEAAGLFRFPTSDGATLVGVLLGSDLCEWIPQARAFARRGYRVLVFDFAGFGDSRPGPDSRADNDVVAATAELRRRGADKRLLVVGGGGHGTSLVEFGPDAPRVLAAVRAFIADHT